MYISTGNYWNFFGVPVSKLTPIIEFHSAKVIWQESGNSTFAQCSIIT